MQLTKPKMIIFDAGRTLINYKEINIRKGIEAYYPYIISNPHQYTVEEIEKYDDEIFGSFDPCRENRFEIPMENKLRLLFDLLEIQFSISLNEVAKIEWEGSCYRDSEPRSRFAALAERGKDKNRSHFQL